MSEELKRRLVGVGVLLAVFSLVAWWVGSRNQDTMDIPSSQAQIRSYDVRELPRIEQAQKPEPAVTEPVADAQTDRAPVSDEQAEGQVEGESSQVSGSRFGSSSDGSTDAEKVQATAPTGSPEAGSGSATKKQEQAVGPATDPQGQWIVQLASVTQKTNADKLSDKLKNQGWNSFVEEGVVNGKTYYRVRVGGYADRKTAELAAQQLQKEQAHKVAVMNR